MNILVIEDHAPQRKLADHVLSAAGHRVVSAVDVGKALESIGANRPDAILVDLSLPGRDGLELARMLKADPATKGIAVVAITSFPEKFSREAALRAGCDAYLVKPVSTRDLPELVAGALRKSEEGRP